MNPRTAAGLAALAILLAGTTSPTAMFVVYRTEWGLSTADLGVVFAAYVGTLLPVLLVLGGIADRIGRRAAVALGLSLALCGLAVLALASGLGGLVAARLLQGAGVGIASGALTASITEAHRGSLPAGAWTAIASSAGIFVGPLMTAAAFDAGAGTHVAYAPILLVTLASGAALPLLAARPATIGEAPDETPLEPATVARAMAFVLTGTFIGWAGFSVFLSMVPAFLSATLHAHDPLVGAAVISALQVASIVATLRLRMVAPERAAVVGPLAEIAGLIVLVVGTSLHGALGWVFVALATILVGAAGGVGFAAMIALTARVARGQRARIFARLYIAAYLGFSVPALVVGTIGARSSLTAGFGFLIAVLALIGAALPALRARARVIPAPRAELSSSKDER